MKKEKNNAKTSTGKTVKVILTIHVGIGMLTISWMT